MKASDFDYYLPKELIVEYPLKKRDESRLLALDRRNGHITHSNFFDIVNYLKKGDLLILNNTKVVPAKLIGKIDSNETEILLTNRISETEWKILVNNPKKGRNIKFEGEIQGTLLRNRSDEWVIEFNKSVDEYIYDFGKMPLPPYIERLPEETDKETYQTVFAKRDGAIAAPTAGLHFTDELLEKIRKNGVEVRFITLHVGVGTFRPVKSEDISNHVMHEEFVEIPVKTFNAVLKAKEDSRRIIAVGTTVVRALESVNKFDSLTFNSDLFIFPPYDFKFVDAMITNFHLPRSTLLMLVSAFCSRELLFTAYEEAIRERYRLLSYGDAMFIY